MSVSPQRQKNKAAPWSLTSLNTENMLYGESVSEALGYKRPCHLQKMKSGEERNDAPRAAQTWEVALSHGAVTFKSFHSTVPKIVVLGPPAAGKTTIVSALYAVLWCCHLSQAAELGWDCTSLSSALLSFADSPLASYFLIARGSRVHGRKPRKY